MKLRPYQQKALETTREHLRAGARRVLVVAPTGSGKSVLAGAMIGPASQKGLKVLVMAHRRELIRQLWVKVVRAGVDPSETSVVVGGVGMPRQRRLYTRSVGELDDNELWSEYAGRRPGAKVTVASVQTLARRETPECDLLVIDEAHRSRATTYERIIEETGCLTVGFTATPVRTDGKCLGDCYEQMVVVATYAELAEQGYLVPCTRAFLPPPDLRPDPAEFARKGQDYDLSQVGEILGERKMVDGIVRQWLKHGQRAPTFAFCSTVAHSKSLRDEFGAAGVRAAHIDANTPTHERAKTLYLLGQHEIDVVCNVDVCTEGTDVPSVKTIVIARPTLSLRVYLQMVGRASRPSENELPFTILDHAGAFAQEGFGWPQDDRDWSLKKKKKKKATGPVTKTCPECYAMVPPGTVTCPECGYQWERAESDVDWVEAELEERRYIESIANERDALDAWQLVIDEFNAANNKRQVPYSPKWCYVRFKERWGKAPPAAARLPELTAAQADRREKFTRLSKIAKARGFKKQWVYVQMGR